MFAAWLPFLLKPILVLFSCVSTFDAGGAFSSVLRALFIAFPRIEQRRLLLIKLVFKLSFPHDSSIRAKATLYWLAFHASL